MTPSKNFTLAELLADPSVVVMAVVDGARHPEKSGDQITENGFQQSEATAMLLTEPYDAIFHSEKLRTAQAVTTIVLAQLACNLYMMTPPKIRLHPSFRVDHLLGDETDPKLGYVEAAAKLGNGDTTIQQWMDEMPVLMEVVRPKLEEAIIAVGLATNRRLGGDVIARVLFGTHSPIGETAVPDPTTFPRLKEACVARYIVGTRNGGRVEILGAEHIACPI